MPLDYEPDKAALSKRYRTLAEHLRSMAQHPKTPALQRADLLAAAQELEGFAER
jgi:hypothetical protein